MVMKISYAPLWKLLIDKKMGKVELAKAAGIGTAALAKMSKDNKVSMEVLGKVCATLGVTFGDIVVYIHEPSDGSDGQ
jgi:DNA-binding Xre family transcriptional regulator